MSADEFQDFSYATHWEKLAGEIEQSLRRWLWTQEGALTAEQCTVELKQKLHFRREPYLLSLQLPGEIRQEMTDPGDAPDSSPPASTGSYQSSSGTDEGEDFDFLPANESEVKSEKLRTRSNPLFSKQLFVSALSQFDGDGTLLQRWFGIGRYALLRAGNATGRILDNQEASTLLSAASVALAEFPRPLPIFVPVHNAFKDAYRGVAVVDGRSVFFDVDSSHKIQQAEHLRDVLGQLQVFAKQLQQYCPKAARLCEDIACGTESAVEGYEIRVASCVTYKLPLPTISTRLKSAALEQDTEQVEKEMTALWSDEWDTDCVWQPWAAQRDPVAAIELDLMWSDVELTPENPTPVLSAMNAAQWRLHPLCEERHVYGSWAIFSSKNSFNRRHLRFPSVREGVADAAVAEFDGDNFRSMATRLSSLLQAVYVAEAARSVAELGSEEWWDASGTPGPTVPTDDIFRDSVEDMFGENFTGNRLWSMTHNVDYLQPPQGQGGRWTRLVPLDSLTARLGLHAVVYRNPKAVALLWGRFVQIIRLQYWERLHHIPLCPKREVKGGMGPEGPDLNACLIHQKLQMLNVCIHRLEKRRRTKSVDPGEEGPSEVDGTAEEASADDNSHTKPRGVAGVLKGAFLEAHHDVPIHIPITQLMPVYTSDSLIEEETLLSALHDSPEDRERAAREQAKVLLSDMSAFKAANPQAQLGDFIKWHSPKDWVKQANGEGCLSTRMSHECDNRWKLHWTEVEACPASEQIPLFDPAMAGERALYFLETIEPSKLFWQLFQVGLVACFGCLCRAQCSRLKRIQQECSHFQDALKEGLDRMDYQPEHASEILDQFRALERNVVTAESLLRHLPNCDVTVSHLLDSVLGMSSPEKSGPGVCVPQGEKEHVLKLLLHGEAASSSEEHRRALCGTVLQHEWVITCHQKGCDSDHGELCQRLYFKDAVNEVRLGSVIVSDL